MQMDEPGTERRCQSCGHKIDTLDKQGLRADGTPSDDYCKGCYQEGHFTLPDATIDDMVRISAATLMANDPGVTGEDAVAQMEAVLPTLRRWRLAQSASQGHKAEPDML